MALNDARDLASVTIKREALSGAAAELRDAQSVTTPPSGKTARKQRPVRTPAPWRAAATDRIQRAGRFVFRLALAAAAVTIAVALGVQSGRALVRNGTPFSTMTYGPWVQWTEAGRRDADPYTRAHLVQSGVLRLSADSAGVFEASTDASGAYLHSSCDYVLEGPYAGGAWWSIAVFDASGNMISNDAGRYAFTSDTAASNPDGSYIVTLGRDARPGNWLPTSGAGRLVVVFTLLDPATGLSEEERKERYKLLPEIRQEACS